METAYIRINRVTEDKNGGTFGVLVLNGSPFCLTLEPAWKMNEKNFSCIPEGQYIACRYNSSKYGNVWMLDNVPGRSFIEIHAGNIIKDTNGCILLGMKYGMLDGWPAVLESKVALKAFNHVLEPCIMLHITIKNCF